MWGQCAIRIRVLVCGVLMAVSGCQSPFGNRPLIESGSPITPRNLASQENPGDTEGGAGEGQTRRKPNPCHPHCPWWDEDAKGMNPHVTPERIRGGIY